MLLLFGWLLILYTVLCLCCVFCDLVSPFLFFCSNYCSDFVVFFAVCECVVCVAFTPCLMLSLWLFVCFGVTIILFSVALCCLCDCCFYVVVLWCLLSVHVFLVISPDHCVYPDCFWFFNIIFSVLGLFLFMHAKNLLSATLVPTALPSMSPPMPNDRVHVHVHVHTLVVSAFPMSNSQCPYPCSCFSLSLLLILTTLPSYLHTTCRLLYYCTSCTPSHTCTCHFWLCDHFTSSFHRGFLYIYAYISYLLLLPSQYLLLVIPQSLVWLSVCMSTCTCVCVTDWLHLCFPVCLVCLSTLVLIGLPTQLYVFFLPHWPLPLTSSWPPP